MSRLLDICTDYFRAGDWQFQLVADDNLIIATVLGNHGAWECRVYVEEDNELVMCYSVSPLFVSAQRIGAMAEFLMRANYGLPVGNFELDVDDGEIRFKTSIDIEDTNFDTVMLRNLVQTNVLQMDRYLPGIAAVENRTHTPAEAIKLVEGADD